MSFWCRINFGSEESWWDRGIKKGAKWWAGPFHPKHIRAHSWLFSHLGAAPLTLSGV